MKTWACLCELGEVRSTVVTKNALRWEAWWQFVHSDRRACPEEAMAASVLFHFWGSMGVSEAKAESVGSILKHFGSTSNLGTQGIVEKTLLRDAGICGDGSDDDFLVLCWSMFFGDASPSTFTFQKKRSAGLARKRYACGKGSLFLHRTIVKTKPKRIWSGAMRREVFRASAAFPKPAKPNGGQSGTSRATRGLGLQSWSRQLSAVRNAVDSGRCC